MTRRENTLKAVRFERPESIPVAFHINGSCWAHYDHSQLHDLCEAHPRLFPGFRRPEKPFTPVFTGACRAGEPFTDPWGCVWQTAENGIQGAVVGHPLTDLDALDLFTPPDPEKTDGERAMDWAKIAADFEKAAENGGIARGNLQHGHTFLRLTYLRGYEALTFDMFDEDPRLDRLAEMVEAFNAGLVARYLRSGAEWISYPEDLGMQVGPMISPENFLRYIKPSYKRLMAPAREAGCVIHMHSDGDIRLLAADLIDGGVDALNLQDLVNGIDWIRDNLKGRVCIDLDVDRQSVTRFGTPKQIDELIRTEVSELGSPEGGLMMLFGLYPGTPIENVEALMDAMERYSTYYA